MKKVLLVEDEAMVRRVIGKMLKRLPLEVREAEDGAQGLALVRDEPFDLLITDYRMPRLDGLAMLTQCRSRGAQLPCIVISAEWVHIDEIENTFFLQKPIHIDVLAELIKDLLKFA